ncbi:TFIIA-alpha and beta-like factor isoform X1 [Pantherophis guttatus]|uniref:TFIIA-alpha and beta-like factor isoform X1 n=1 Tax=Pantherophis guttatus TaxID=94885 RepID=A0A6P9CUY5_PANGU|nr:TFIIA-alpha and beta-like factor isoform X1 [Pantherophis guttatus]
MEPPAEAGGAAREREREKERREREAMAHGNPVPKFYKSVIDDVIEGVRDVFLEEGVDEQILKELKRRWEMKVMQSKATEGFFRHNHVLPQFTLHLPSSFQALQTTGVTAGRGMRQFTNCTPPAVAAELESPQSSGAVLSLPSGLTYPIQIPPGVTLQTTSGHLYKVNMPVVVTQATGGGTAIQNSLQQIFQQVGKQSLVAQPAPVNIIQANMSSLQETSNGSLLTSKLPQHVKMGDKDLLGAAAATLEATRSQGEVAIGTLVSLQPSSSLQTPQIAVTTVPVAKSSGVENPRSREAREGISSGGGPLSVNIDQPPEPDDIIELIIMGNDLDDPALLSDETSLSFVEELDTSVQMESDLLTQKNISNDLEEIIQLDGTSDLSPKAEIESPRDGEDEELVGIIDAEDLKVLDEEEEEEGENSTSDNQSLNSTSDADESSVDIVEEDPLNSGDDVSEQETPDVFDTDNIIVCQYDKVQRSKNRWKFYLKDGVMCFGGKDYIFSKAIGDAEW